MEAEPDGIIRFELCSPTLMPKLDDDGRGLVERKTNHRTYDFVNRKLSFKDDKIWMHQYRM